VLIFYSSRVDCEFEVVDSKFHFKFKFLCIT